MQVLFVSGIPGGTRRYRCDHHREQLALVGVQSVLRVTEAPNDVNSLYSDVVNADAVILHRVSYGDVIADLIDLARLQGKPVIFETDDLIFEPDLFQQIGLIDSLTPEERQRFRLDMVRQLQTLQQADCVLTTTQSLAQAVEARSKPVYIHRNAASQEMVEQSLVAYNQRQEQPQQKSTVTLGYFSGSGSHDRDFAVITPALLTLMENHSHLHMHIGGALGLDPRFHRFQHRIHRAPYLSWQELPQLIAAVDINLAPLEIENPFCQAKSEIKWMEAALVGVPTVATATDAFQYAVRHGEDGLLAILPEDWHDLLSRLILDQNWREEIGRAAYRRAYADYTPEVAAVRLNETLQAILNKQSSPAADGEILAREIARRMQQHQNQMQSTIDELAHRLEAVSNAYAHLQSEVRTLRLEERGRAQQQIEQIEQQHREALQAILRRIEEQPLSIWPEDLRNGKVNGNRYESA
jgi:O-antigen biosynthesis protein